MNIITFFQELANKWNAENKCGFCWTFGGPLSESGMNASKSTEDDKCCTHLFLTSYETSSGYELAYSNGVLPGVNRKDWCDHIFTLWAVQNANLGTNTYNEQQGFPISESLWKTIYEPLQNCLGCGKEMELCEMGYDFEITKWNMKVEKYVGDQNYTGWRIMGIFRQYKN